MPAIVPNLLLINADVAARERASAIMAQLPGRLVLANDFETAFQLLARNLIDLIICDNNVTIQGQPIDDAIAQFHELPGRDDVPVLFTCAVQRSDVSLKTHRWGVAYHVHQAVAPQVLLGLIQTSLTLKVRATTPHYNFEHPPSYSQSPPVANEVHQTVPKPFGLTLPEVIMPSPESSQSLQSREW